MFEVTRALNNRQKIVKRREKIILNLGLANKYLMNMMELYKKS
jgi:hypothetical protein